MQNIEDKYSKQKIEMIRGIMDDAESNKEFIKFMERSYEYDKECNKEIANIYKNEQNKNNTLK